MLRIDGKVPRRPPKSQTFCDCATKLRKIRCKTFPRKTYVTSFRGFVHNILSKFLDKTVCENSILSINCFISDFIKPISLYSADCHHK